MGEVVDVHTMYQAARAVIVYLSLGFSLAIFPLVLIMEKRKRKREVEG